MKVLIVEDDPDYVDALTVIVKSCDRNAVIESVTDATTAMNLIGSDFFDVILLDMSIPANKGDGSHDVRHGVTVLSAAQVDAPGTPVFVLTGSGGHAYEEHIDGIMEKARKVDIWGANRDFSLLNFIPKLYVNRFEGKFKEYAESYLAMKSVELEKGELQLTPQQDTLIRSFARSRDGVSCEVNAIGDGLSSATVYRLLIRGDRGNITDRVVCKLGSYQGMAEEAKRYDKFVYRLPPEATPRKFALLSAGAKQDGGVFYTLADGYEDTVFSVLFDNVRIESIVNQLQKITSVWPQSPEAKTVADIRRLTLSDAGFEKVRPTMGMDWIEGIERFRVQTRWTCCHGDLHGLNVLVDQKNNPVLIDFGDMADGPACRDPVTLELSALFHKNGPLKGKGWPNAATALNWAELDLYLEDCPAPNFVKACREWAESQAQGSRDIPAMAYAFLLRQFKYDDTDKELARNLLLGIKAAFDQT